MNKNIFLLFILISIFSLNAQIRGIQLINTKSGKEIFIKERKNIKINTKDGSKIKGSFVLPSNDTLFIANQLIALDDIVAIKRNSLVSSIVSSGAFIYAGALTAGIGTIIGLFIEPAGFLLFIPATGLIYAGVKSPNFHKNYSKDKNWHIEFVTSPKRDEVSDALLHNR